jgi:hypothetical protein
MFLLKIQSPSDVLTKILKTFPPDLLFLLLRVWRWLSDEETYARSSVTD